MKNCKLIQGVVIGLLAFLLILQPASVYAANENEDPQRGTSMSNIEQDSNDIALLSLFADPYTGLIYDHNHPNTDKGFVYGIDVSYHNGSINWSAVKNAGIENVMIRVGYRGYGSAGSLNEDVNYRQNIEGALNAGLNVGVYFFSQAINQQEASDEADFVIERIKGYNIALPVVIDFEYADTGSGLGGRLYNVNLSVSRATGVCKAFCRIVEESGYSAMVYANKSMLENNLDARDLSNKYMIWLANYTTSTSYSGQYDVWQYSSKGSVNGISGNVDCNFWYKGSDTVSSSDVVYNGVNYSAVYDYDYYIAKYEDIRSAFGGDTRRTLEHFVASGMSEGRQGNAEFNVYTYKNRYSDLRNAFGDDLKSYYIHYITCGKQEGRDGSGTTEVSGSVSNYEGVDYSLVYDYNYYIENNADVAQAFGGDANLVLQHFVTNGMSEGRQGNASFNVYTYKNRYADLRSTFGNDLRSYYMHYITYGKQEGRNGSGTSEMQGGVTFYEGIDYADVYDYNYYIGLYADIKEAFGGDDYRVLQHFVTNGMSEGRQGNEEFNVYVYRDSYTDLRNTFGSDLKSYYLHYILNGKQEGRRAEHVSEESINTNNDNITAYDGVDYSAVYDKEYYLEHYTDVRETIGDNADSLLQHFVLNGIHEGRQGNEEFNVYVYRDRYNDLEEAFGDDLASYYIHYITCGKAEGREGYIEAEVQVQSDDIVEEELINSADDRIEENIEGTGEEPVPSEME